MVCVANGGDSGMMQPFNRVLRYIVPMFHMDALRNLYPANNTIPRTLGQGMLVENANAFARFRTTGLMEPQLGGDLVTVQTLLRGANPLDVAAVAGLRQAQNNIQ